MEKPRPTGAFPERSRAPASVSTEQLNTMCKQSVSVGCQGPSSLIGTCLVIAARDRFRAAHTLARLVASNVRSQTLVPPSIDFFHGPAQRPRKSGLDRG